MKKLIALLFLTFFAISTFSQERTLSTYRLPKSQTYYKYTAVGADTLKYETQDTIDIPIYVNKDYPVQFYANFNVDTIGDNDFKLQVKVLGKVFEDESWTAITDDTSDDITANDTNFAIYSQSGPSYSIASVVDTIAFDAAEDLFNADSTITVAARAGTIESLARTVTQTYSGQYYRYLLFRLILTDTSTTGDGFTLNNMELKIWERKF